MDSFGYLSVLLSIILGLGLTQLLTATGRMIRHRERVRVHWLPLLWAGILLVIYGQVWWSMYGLRLRHDWTFFAFSVVIAQTATLYLMAAVALPEQVDEAGIDLGGYYDRQHAWFFGFFLATLGVSVLKDVVLSGSLPDRTNLAFHIALGAGCIAGMISQSRRFHEVLGVGFGVAIMAYVGMLFAHLR